MRKSQAKKLIIIFVFLIVTGLLYEFPKYIDYYDDLVHVYFFDVGQGDSILIKTPDRKLILTDGGNNNSVLYRISEVLPFWIKRIDYVVVSHPHADHIFGLISLMESYEIGCLKYGGTGDTISKVEEELRNTISTESISVTDDCIGGVMKYYMPGGNDHTYNPNLKSLVSIYSYRDFDVLLTGDAEIPEQIKALPSFSSDIEIIKVPHHGAKDSFYRPLLLALKPEAAVISVGENNAYHLPSASTIDGYEQLGIKVFRTDKDGSIEVISDGYLWSIVEWQYLL